MKQFADSIYLTLAGPWTSFSNKSVSFHLKKKKVAKHSFKEYSSVLKLFYLRGKEQEGFLPARRKKQRTHSHLRLMPK